MNRIAFLGRGAHTLPTYRALLNRLAEQNTLIVYSEVPIDPRWLAFRINYTLRGITKKKLPRRIREILLLFVLIKDHRKDPFDLIHAHSTYPTGFVAVLLQKLFGVPAIVSLDGAEGSALADLKFGDLLHTRRSIINRWVINHSKVVTALTEFQRNEVYKNLKIKRDIKVIPRGVELDRFRSQQIGDSGTPVIFLSVGYLLPLKDPVTLLEAFFLIQQSVDSRLIHIGKDYMGGKIQRLAAEMGISGKVTFIGYADHDCIHEFYKKADILLHTSRYESQGMVVSEALASGTLVCGTRVGLMSDLADECCVTVLPRDASGLAYAVLDLLKDQNKMLSMREAGYRWSERNNLDTCTNQINHIYKRLIEKNP